MRGLHCELDGTTTQSHKRKGTVRFLGLGIHAETIAVAVAQTDGEVRSLGIIPNREESIRRLIKKLGSPGSRPTSAAAPDGSRLRGLGPRLSE